MRILFVSPYPASHVRSRLLGFVKRLAQHHQVEMLALCTTAREQADVLTLQQQGFTVTTHTESMIRCTLRSIAALSSYQPLQVAFCSSPSLRALLLEHLQAGRFDLLHVEGLRCLDLLPWPDLLPTVWDAVDCISQLYLHGGQVGATWRLRLLGKLEAARVRAYEREQLWRFPHVLVTAERERQALLAIAKDDEYPPGPGQRLAEITVLSHGIDQQYFRPYSGKRQIDTLVFSGKMSFHANIAAVQLLTRHIMPLIWRQRPEVRLVIAGSEPPSQIRRLARDPRIEVTGYLPDLRLVISQAQVAVCPLPYAAGIQNKVLEAMALGTPVVASSCVAAGLQAIPGEDLLIADDPGSFALAVLRLLEDQVLWHQLAARGVAYISTYHGWDRVIEQLNAVYHRALGVTV